MKKITLLWIGLCLFKPIFSQSPCPPSTQQGIHIVQKGETFYGISKKYKISLAQLYAWNNKTENEVLLPCTALKVMQIGSKSVPKAYNTISKVTSKEAMDKEAAVVDLLYSDNKENPPIETVPKSYQIVSTVSISPNYNYFKNSPYLPFYHIASQGETPQSIANLYSLTLSDVMMMNNISSNISLEAGQKLMLEDRSQQRHENYIFEKVENPNISVATPVNYTIQATPEANSQQNTPKQAATPQKSQSNAPTNTNSSTAMTSEEMDMVREINLVRNNPSAYVTFIEEYINYLRQSGDMGNSIQTSYELIDELKRTPTLSTLQPLQCIYTAAKKHGEDQKRRGDTDHVGSDGSYPWDRVLRECPDLKDGNENLVGGPSSVRRAVILLLVDDGIDNRGHRKTMLNPDWKYVACYKMGTVGSMPNCWVQKFGF